MNYLAVLVSGRGTNLQAIIDAIDEGILPDTQVSVVVSNRKDAYALRRAEAHGIPTIYHPLLPYKKAGRSRREYDEDLAKKLAQYPVDLVVLAGWMHILSSSFLRHYANRVINIHPALPGAFPGTHAIERAYEAFKRGEIDRTGVMVHYVPDEGVDCGPVIIQREVPIYPQDSLEDLEERIHRVEHEIYIQAIAQVLGVKLRPRRS
ncbi:MAG: phosphoribosylglycinamide formyltransferase [Anaerolineae bacterium]|nr:phosphoribosylglycinamide formyltransferase [Anaerolineae bacterium]